jgi:hypothetical protein
LRCGGKLDISLGSDALALCREMGGGVQLGGQGQGYRARTGMRDGIYVANLLLRAFPTWLTSDNAVKVHNEVGSQVWKVASRPKAMLKKNRTSERTHLFICLYFACCLALTCAKQRRKGKSVREAKN